MAAICIRNANKKYGSKTVIQKFNMTVPEGSIYSLLGSSGCGKSTILNCILGLKNLDEGSIEIFGFSPKSEKSGIPAGNRIGFQPQELSLFKELSVTEVLFYFGRIYGLEKSKIFVRMDFILKLLKLEENSRHQIRNLSGGQQRRVSFAVALIHEAPILILDEPTVGVDPLLRKCIWDHLNYLSNHCGTTIIITTHYINEAEQSSMVGIMRNGRLLIEDTPQNLNQMYNQDLQSIVRELCRQDENSEILPQNVANLGPERCKILPWDSTKNKPKFHKRISALVIRNLLQIWRNLGFVLFLLLFPAVGIFLAVLAVSGNISHLNFGLVNPENFGEICPKFENLPDICGEVNISCHFISRFPQNEIIWKYYPNEEKALEDARKGITWGYISISENFSEIFPYTPQNNMKVHIDATNKIVLYEILKNIQETYEVFTEAWYETCSSFDVGPFEKPLILTKLFVGKDVEAEFSKFVGPAINLIFIFFMGITLTGLTLIMEKKSGMYERSLVAGVHPNEIVIAHFLSQIGIVIIQCTISLIVLLQIFHFEIRGPLLGIILLTLGQGIIGILVGFVISTICSEESSVMQLTVVIVMPLFLVSGIIWPIEGMPVILKYIAYGLPQTFPGLALRSIMVRGWGFGKFVVILGHIVTLIWIVVLIGIIYLLNKIFK